MVTRRDALTLMAGAMPAAWLGPRATGVSNRPYVFLYRMMDRYFQGSVVRLVQSFVPTPALNLGDTGFIYDNALVIIALLARGTPQDVARARLLGNAIVYAQAHDPINDGRIRTAYFVDPLVRKDGTVRFPGGLNFDVGNTAWTGLALMHLYAKTLASAYLEAAIALGTWVYVNAADSRGPGGYTGGLTASGQRIRWKSTEHNIDTYAFFTLLGAATGDATWASRAAPALAFVDSMWNERRGFYWIGSLDNGVSANTIPIPEDVQSWSYLATRRAPYAASIDWAYANLSAVDGLFRGVSFSNADRSGVWFEGTAHLAAALLQRNAPGDAAKAAAYLASIKLAESEAMYADGYGIVAASKNGLRTGDGDRYFEALHIGATSWYAIAELHGNPFLLA